MSELEVRGKGMRGVGGDPDPEKMIWSLKMCYITYTYTYWVIFALF